MGIEHIKKSIFNLSKTLPQQKTLKPGQILQGKIVKLYPNNKAEILLGSQKMVAQVKTPLTIGEKYHFQVQSVEEVLHLKVLGERLIAEEKVNIKSLLQQLGMKTTKVNTAFTQSLLNEKIAFDTSQLTHAFDLLAGAKDKLQAQAVLKEIIVAKLPVNDAVFQALLIHYTNGISEQMKALLVRLKQEKIDNRLAELLSQMIERPAGVKAAFVKQILIENKQNNPQLLHLLKASGLVSISIDFPTWKLQWRAFAERSNAAPNNIAHQALNTVMPFELDNSRVINALEKVVSGQNQKALQHEAAKILQAEGNKLTQVNLEHTVLTDQGLTVLIQRIAQKIMPLLQVDQQQQIAAFLQHNPPNLQYISLFLQMLADKQFYIDTKDLLTKMRLDNLFLQGTPKEQFLTQLNQLLRVTGLTYENQLWNADIEQQSPSIKGMLLQLVQKNDGTVHERGQQLLHFINGMQINSVRDANHFIQASLQIPGEKLALESDIELTFSGSKTRNGEINSDYCQIVFYLDLTHLKQTVIDMNIHKRVVNVTIYNDVMKPNHPISPLQSILKQALATLDYHLSGIVYRTLEQKEEAVMLTQMKGFKPTYQGVDYRI